MLLSSVSILKPHSYFSVANSTYGGPCMDRTGAGLCAWCRSSSPQVQQVWLPSVNRWRTCGPRGQETCLRSYSHRWQDQGSHPGTSAFRPLVPLPCWRGSRQPCHSPGHSGACASHMQDDRSIQSSLPSSQSRWPAFSTHVGAKTLYVFLLAQHHFRNVSRRERSPRTALPQGWEVVVSIFNFLSSQTHPLF